MWRLESPRKVPNVTVYCYMVSLSGESIESFMFQQLYSTVNEWFWLYDIIWIPHRCASYGRWMWSLYQGSNRMKDEDVRGGEQTVSLMT